MATEFQVISATIEVEDHPPITTYGIEAVGDTNICRVEDISSDKDTVQSLCALLQERDLSPLHLPDVVHDFLNR